ncbi:MAG TPA: penicillin-binding transpeptidase domain-containing protein, partial [Pyrinomonadaceae bacterium]|nr:penicillin-binding transpeptidase domain-containing protein [Pyrinomonadaceae bacterium]
VQSSNEVLLGSPRAELDFVSFHEELLMNQMGFPRAARVAFIFFIFFAFILSVSIETSAKGKRTKGKAARSSKSTRARASSRTARNRRGRVQVARSDRRRGRVRLSKRQVRAERARAAREQAAHIAKLQRRLGRKLTRRELAAESRRFGGSRRRALEEARRRAEAARQAAIARQRAIDEGFRRETQANIANDSSLGEDPEVRAAAVSALGNTAGTVVVMDPKTGRVYTVVNQEWGVRRGFKPCSTIKLVTGVAGITERVISPIEPVSDGGRHRLDLTDALAYSNNTYFQHVGGQIGFDKMVSYAREMGLGEKTGINYTNESPGKVPLFKSGWAVNRMSSHGDDFEVTAIQLGTMVSAISNGGKLLVPHLPRSVEENSHFKTEVRRKVTVEKEAWNRLLPGMIGAVNYGSGRRAYRPEQTVAGKTGTCIGQGAWVGLFTSYAPVVNPKLAVVVITRGSAGRGKHAAAIAGNIYRALSPRFGTNIEFQVAETDDATNSNNKADALNEEAAETKAATEAEEAGEELDANGTPVTASPNIDLKVKPTTMPVENKPKTGAPAKTTPKDPVDGRTRRIQPQPQPKP